MIVTLPASAAGRHLRGGFGFGPVFGPWDYPWGYWYEPYAYGGYPGMGSGNAGEIKLETPVKDAEVFINGAYAGTAGSLKSMWLRQGAYNLELRSPGRARYEERIYVLSGKTMRVRPELRIEQKP